MKKFLLLLFLPSVALAYIDTDNDGYEDDVDICPFVRGVSEHQGCPDVSVYSGVGDEVQLIQRHACYKQVAVSQGYIYGSVVCHDGQCPVIQKSPSFRICDIIFPVVLSPVDNSPIKRGPVYFLKDM